jgi:hypothetical protein
MHVVVPTVGGGKWHATQVYSRSGETGPLKTRDASNFRALPNGSGSSPVQAYDAKIPLRTVLRPHQAPGFRRSTEVSRR